jgi:cytochrome c oxidase, subunit II
MFNDFPLFPEQASTISTQVDMLYFFLIAVTGLMALAVFLLVIFFAIKYRRRPGNEIPEEYHAPHYLEYALIASWTAIFMVMFVWSAKVYFVSSRPPDNSLQIYGTAKQWMWRFQHPDGKSEINELHVPLGQPVKVTMGSEDVIHSFFVPAFRVKRDVLPNRFTTVWFTPTKLGRYHLFCAEYCGTNHSGMIGWVEVMEPSEYQLWAAGGGAEGSPAAQGKKLFEKFACNTCHMDSSTGRGPVLTGVFGHTVRLNNGEQIVADENYLRESILDPQAKVVDGFSPVMPTFRGQLSETDLLQLVAYVKSLTPQTAATPQEPAQSQAASPGARPSNLQGTVPSNPVPKNRSKVKQL